MIYIKCVCIILLGKQTKNTQKALNICKQKIIYFIYIFCIYV